MTLVLRRFPRSGQHFLCVCTPLVFQMTVSDMITTFIFFLAAGATPGPINLVLLTAGAAFDLRRCSLLIFGALIGLTVVFAGSVIGTGTLSSAHPAFRTTLSIIAVVYLTHVAWRVLRSQPTNEADLRFAPTWTDMIFMQCVNPKAWLFMGAFALHYLPTQGSIWDVLIVWLICISTGASTMSVYAALGGTAKTPYSITPRHARRVDRRSSAFGVVACSHSILRAFLERFTETCF